MKRLIALGIFGGFLFFSLTIWAQVPQLLNYQGRLTDDMGIPIITSTTVRFSIYQGGDAATPGSGTLVYEEDASVTPDDNGVFSHLIGSGTVIFGALDATVFQTAEPVFLEIAIDPAGANETLLPRKQIVTVGYSFKSELADDADTVDGQDASAFAPMAHHHDADYVNEGQPNSVNSKMIVDDTLVDADISAKANISASKIDPTGLNADLVDGEHADAFVHTAGDDMTGTLNVNTSTAYALYATSSSSMARAVYGYASNTSGTNYGVYGGSVSAQGGGVYGLSSATSGTNYGVFGASASTSGYGVYGSATATTGINYGIYGISSSGSGYGVYGTAPFRGVYGWASNTVGVNYGVYGISDSTLGRGVCGWATADEGMNYGVYGRSDSNSGYGVYGWASAKIGTSYGVYGSSDSTNGYGVYGHASSTGGYGVYGGAPYTGVYGTGAISGVHGQSYSQSGHGVYGEATATSGNTDGVYGQSASPYGSGVKGSAPYRGVYGYATATTDTNYGVYGRSDSNSGRGVYGWASATSGTNYGVYGNTNSSSGYAGYFEGNAHVTGEFTAGIKSCVQPIDNGKKVLLYAMESPEIWFEDFGTAQLINGQAVVQLESVFTQAANTEAGYMVFLTPIGEWKGLYISRQDKDSFEVREQGDGTSSISFYYRIVAKRRGYEEVRFEEFTEPEQPPAEPNLPVEKK